MAINEREYHDQGDTLKEILMDIEFHKRGTQKLVKILYILIIVVLVLGIAMEALSFLDYIFRDLFGKSSRSSPLGLMSSPYVSRLVGIATRIIIALLILMAARLGFELLHGLNYQTELLKLMAQHMGAAPHNSSSNANAPSSDPFSPGSPTPRADAHAFPSQPPGSSGSPSRGDARAAMDAFLEEPAAPHASYRDKYAAPQNSRRPPLEDDAPGPSGNPAPASPTQDGNPLFTCAHCGYQRSIPKEYVGKAIKCPKCHQVNRPTT